MTTIPKVEPVVEHRFKTTTGADVEMYTASGVKGDYIGWNVTKNGDEWLGSLARLEFAIELVRLAREHRAALAAAEAAGAKKECRWTEDEDGNWHMSCGSVFVFIEGGPKENDMSYCCGCGCRLISVPLVLEEEKDGE